MTALPLFLSAFLFQPAADAPPAPPAPDAEQVRFADCAALARSDAAAAATRAESWRDGGGGIPARQCLGLAYSALGRDAAAAAAFTQAAKDAELRRDGRASLLWVLAGNASLAAAEAVPARTALSRALELGGLGGAQTGEAHLDRARAAVALGDMAAARTDLDAALKLVPGDPMAWLLSATLARRQGEGTRAARDIAEADRLAPGNAAIAYESGNIAMLNGLPDAARAAWTRAAAAKGEPVAESAAAALAANPAR